MVRSSSYNFEVDRMAKVNAAFELQPAQGENGTSDHTGTQPVNGGGSKTSQQPRGSTISFHSLNYTVVISERRCRRGKKQILTDVNGLFRPGMNAIMGPTGSGKTTLLDVLADRCERSGISGHLLLDGQKPPKNYKCMTGYVVQDDVVMGTLSVRENLMFSANLRLSNSEYSYEERVAKVNETIRELGLTKCADTKIGTQFIRGVSGGERKRTNIGMELIVSPKVLFLDEPTTGLDANTANSVMTLMYRLSRQGCTVIFSIHQPRFSIFRLFDRLSLLANGRTVYHGEASEALEFFRSAGYECEEFNNPPDFFLDVINGAAAVGSQGEDDGEPANGQAVLNRNGNVEVNIESEAPKKDVAAVLADKFQQSAWCQRLHTELQPILAAFESKGVQTTTKSTETPQYATSFPVQLKYVSQRAFKNFFRNPQASIMQMFVSLFFAVVLGLIFLRLGLEYPGDLQSRFGVMFFLTTNQLFSNLSAIEIFIHERAIFVHENASGFYRVSTYYMSKLFCDLLPMRVLPNLFFIVITYFMIGFQTDAGNFFKFFLCLMLATFAGSAIALAISASVETFAVANLFTILIYLVSMIFGGLLVNLKNMGRWLSWLQYLSVVRYSLNFLSITELKDLTLYQHDQAGNLISTYNGTKWLDDQEIAYATGWEEWRNIFALGVIFIGVEILGYIQLRRMKKLK